METSQKDVWDVPNPTSMNVHRQLDQLFSRLSPDSPTTQKMRENLQQMPLLQALSMFMLRPSLTLLITELFRPLLMDICARWLDIAKESEDNIRALEALALLIEVHDELFPSVISSKMRML
jgi:midasin